MALVQDMWTVRHMGILANGALAFGAWLTIAMGKPFTLDYAREHVDPALWTHPAFIRSNAVITSVWATVFTLNALLAWGKMEHVLLPDWGFELTSYALLIGAAGFTSWWPEYVRRRRG